MYVDGRPVAILHASELPPGLHTRTITNHWGPSPFYFVRDYLAAIGVDVAKVRALHLYGGSRVVTIDGAELRAHGGELAFDFTQGDRGKVEMHFPSGLRVDTTFDLLTQMTIYVDKEPPTLHRDGWGEFLAFADGKRIDGIPYAGGEQLKGTRVYVDGKLVAVVKRRLLADALVASPAVDDRPAEFSLDAYLRSVSASPTSVKAVDLLSDDDLVERLDADAWSARAREMRFSIPAHSRGQITMGLPRLDRAKARISAVQIYVRNEPPKRWLAPPEVVALGGDETRERNVDAL